MFPIKVLGCLFLLGCTKVLRLLKTTLPCGLGAWSKFRPVCARRLHAWLHLRGLV